jgi:hypothetical protein
MLAHATLASEPPNCANSSETRLVIEAGCGRRWGCPWRSRTTLVLVGNPPSSGRSTRQVFLRAPIAWYRSYYTFDPDRPPEDAAARERWELIAANRYRAARARAIPLTFGALVFGALTVVFGVSNLVSGGGIVAWGYIAVALGVFIVLTRAARLSLRTAKKFKEDG